MLARALRLIANHLRLIEEKDESGSALLNCHLDDFKKGLGYVLPLLFDHRIEGDLKFIPSHAQSPGLPDSLANRFLESLDAR
jgi:hypothetical protein